MVNITTNPTGSMRANGASRSIVGRPAHRVRKGTPCVSIVGFDRFALDRVAPKSGLRDRASLMYESGSGVGAQRGTGSSLDRWTREKDAGTGFERCA